jgi:sortase A
MRFRATRLRASPLGVLLVLVVGCLAWGATKAPPTTEGAFDIPTLVEAAAIVAPTTAATASTTTTTVPSTTTTTTVRTPVTFNPVPPGGRVNLGGDKHPMVTIPAIGMIEIPKIGLVHPIFEGIDESEIHWGPGHWPGSALPGYKGNAVFAGHRVTHTRPFLDIDLIAVGDKIIFHTQDGTFTYEVTDHVIVSPDATWIVNPTPEPTVTIFGCHPKHSANQRYVVRGKLIAGSPDPNAPG